MNVNEQNLEEKMPEMHENKVHKKKYEIGSMPIVLTLKCLLASVAGGLLVIFARWLIYIKQGKEIDDYFSGTQSVIFVVIFIVLLVVLVETAMPSRLLNDFAELTWRNNRTTWVGDGWLFYAIMVIRYSFKALTFAFWFCIACITVPFTVLHSIVQFGVFLVRRKELDEALYKKVYWFTLVVYIGLLFLRLYLKD